MQLILRNDRARARAFVEAGGMDLSRFPQERDADGRIVARLPFFDDPEKSRRSWASGWSDPAAGQVARSPHRQVRQ